MFLLLYIYQLTSVKENQTCYSSTTKVQEEKTGTGNLFRLVRFPNYCVTCFLACRILPQMTSMKDDHSPWDNKIQREHYLRTDFKK